MLAPMDRHDLAPLTRTQFSVVSEEAALRRPLADLVTATLQSASRSEHTRRAYRTAIGLFLEFLDLERGAMLPEYLGDWRPLAESSRGARGETVWTYRGACAVLRLVDAGLVDGFRAWREAQGDGPNSASARWAVVRTFLAVAYRDGVLSHDQASALGLKPYRQRQKRDVQPVGRRLTREEVRLLRDAPAAKTVKGQRDLAILDVCLFAWLRREEVADLQVEHLRQDGGRWWLVFRGKGGKTRRVKVADPVYRSLTRWLKASGRALGESTGPLFVGVNKAGRLTGKPISADDVSRLVAEYGHRAALSPLTGPNRLTPHDLRRTGARCAYDNGAPLLLIRDQLGHASVETTQRYIGAHQDDGHTASDYVKY